MTESEPKTPGAPRVMDVRRPAAPVAPDHQLVEHGTPDPVPATQNTPVAADPTPHADADVDALLQQVSMEHATLSSSRPRAPIGLIITTITVLVILIAISWFALNSKV